LSYLPRGRAPGTHGAAFLRWVQLALGGTPGRDRPSKPPPRFLRRVQPTPTLPTAGGTHPSFPLHAQNRRLATRQAQPTPPVLQRAQPSPTLPAAGVTRPAGDSRRRRAQSRDATCMRWCKLQSVMARSAAGPATTLRGDLRRPRPAGFPTHTPQPASVGKHARHNGRTPHAHTAARKRGETRPPQRPHSPRTHRGPRAWGTAAAATGAGSPRGAWGNGLSGHGGYSTRPGGCLPWVRLNNYSRLVQLPARVRCAKRGTRCVVDRARKAAKG
jgi:hypothetical protein